MPLKRCYYYRRDYAVTLEVLILILINDNETNCNLSLLLCCAPYR